MYDKGRVRPALLTSPALDVQVTRSGRQFELFASELHGSGRILQPRSRRRLVWLGPYVTTSFLTSEVDACSSFDPS